MSAYEQWNSFVVAGSHRFVSADASADGAVYGSGESGSDSVGGDGDVADE